MTYGLHHHHTHAEGHHEHFRANDGKVFLAGMLLNASFVTAEIIFGVAADSLALLADAGHNAADVLGLGLAWGAGALSRRPPGERFTYGLQSASILAALINAVFLVLVAFEIGREAFVMFSEPRPPTGVTVMAVAAFGMAINGLTAWLFMRGAKHDVNMRGVFWHMLADAMVSLGVVISGALAMWTTLPWIDPLTGLAIAAVILYGSKGLTLEALKLILHAVPEHIRLQEVRECLAALPGVVEVTDLHVWAMSANENSLSAHIVMQGAYPESAWFRGMEQELERRFRIGHSTVQVERAEDAAMGGALRS